MGHGVGILVFLGHFGNHSFVFEQRVNQRLGLA
jgi:hypothetical protein